MAIDKQKMLDEQAALFKKHGKEILLEEIALLCPEIADIVVGLIPEPVRSMIQPFEASGVQKLQDMLKDMIEKKII